MSLTLRPLLNMSASRCRALQSFNRSPLQIRAPLGLRTTSVRSLSELKSEEAPLVYESPLGSVVVKLRTVSLISAFAGVTGVPCMIAIKGVIPETGMLAIAMAFVAGSMGSTVAIHYVFHPYIMRIESVAAPVTNIIPGDNDNEPSSSATLVSTPGHADENVLLKAVTKSLFMRQVDIVFDPDTDVVQYKGYRPLCNFIAKGKPLYVHPEYVYDDRLRKAMRLDESKAIVSEKENPDDLL